MLRKKVMQQLKIDGRPCDGTVIVFLFTSFIYRGFAGE